MQSCDTFILGSGHYAENCTFFAKNSDRPLGEAQPLTLVPGGDHPAGATVQCTHLTLSQAAHTYTVLGSRPYWIWGFEMGCNEMGLVIGNEAENSRCEPETVEGLLGMDMLRLALERCATARESISLITELLETYGQNANANPLFDRRYENTFLLADREEIWLLETAGRKWVAKQITNYVAASNCYTIGREYDLASPDLENYALQKRWQQPNEPFDFTKAYTAPTGMQNGAIPRWRRMQKLISSHEGPLTQEDVKGILRDHFDGELNEPRFGGTYGTFYTICMHAMAWNSPQTAASMLWKWDKELGTILRWAPSVPCCSVYIPVYFTGSLPEALTAGGEFFEEASLWWQMERLAMAVSIDEARFAPQVRPQLDALEARLEALARQAEAAARADLPHKNEILSQATAQATQEAYSLVSQLWAEIRQQVLSDGGLYGARKEFLEAYCDRVNMPLL